MVGVEGSVDCHRFNEMEGECPRGFDLDRGPRGLQLSMRLYAVVLTWLVALDCGMDVEDPVACW